ncbi:MAG: ribosomal RNA small subunit methyltransferase A [Candidatus Lokiarchaeota archaeon]|nr:ribosomal RNA small subunit methyltransferase A [Candidatus Lokiarchaeota archaeon]
MNLQEVKLILDQLNVKPNKLKGQNFLIDDNIANKIIESSKVKKNDTILEIGPGLGALTEKLLEIAKNVICVEIESSFCSYLLERFVNYDNLKVINADILKLDIPQHDKVVSNIPYKITGPILEKLFFKEKSTPGIITIEKKLAKRITNSNDYKNTSRIGINANTFTNPMYICDISPRSFYPAPSIDLSMIAFQPKRNLDSFLKEKSTRRFFLDFIAGIMPYKNKNILNAINIFLKNNTLNKLNKLDVQDILTTQKFDNKKTFCYLPLELLSICKDIYKYI